MAGLLRRDGGTKDRACEGYTLERTVEQADDDDDDVNNCKHFVKTMTHQLESANTQPNARFYSQWNTRDQ